MGRGDGGQGEKEEGEEGEGGGDGGEREGGGGKRGGRTERRKGIMHMYSSTGCRVTPTAFVFVAIFLLVSRQMKVISLCPLAAGAVAQVTCTPSALVNNYVQTAAMEMCTLAPYTCSV